MARDISFTPLERADFADRIIDEIKAMISSGRLLPGDKLPTERDLAAQFGVSRACVREALHSLETLGLIQARVGSGTYLSENPDAILEHLSWVVYFSGSVEGDLRQARLVLEPEIAALAAENATLHDVRALEGCLEKMGACLGNPPEAAVQDFEFHIALARAAHNLVLQEMIVGMQWILRGYISRRLEDCDDLDYICYAEHREIFEAVRDRDPERAREAMRRSVNETKLFETVIKEDT